MLPHVAQIDLFGNGVVYEVIVMRHNKHNGDIYFIRTDYLDDIDRNRVVKILSKRDASRYEAWDLFSQVTLLNGMNALEYFHQFVKVRTRSGEIMAPSLHRAGAAQGAPKLNPGQAPTQLAPQQSLQQHAAAPQVAAPKKAGRPPKANKQ
jgi:hypothetical protein